MSHRKVQITVYLEPEQVTKLKALSVSTHIPQSVYIREAIDIILKRGPWGRGVLSGLAKAKGIEK